MIVLIGAALVAAFVAGKVYGARVEAEAVAVHLRFESLAVREMSAAYRTVVSHIRATRTGILSNVKKYL